MGTFLSHDKLPEPLAYCTIRLLCLIVSMIVVVIAYNFADNPSTIQSCSIASFVVGVGYAIWCAASTTRTWLVFRRKMMWFTAASTGFAICLDCIFILEHKKYLDAEAGHEEIVAAVLYPPVQIAMFAMSLVLAWSMISLMTVSESSESSV